MNTWGKPGEWISKVGVKKIREMDLSHLENVSRTLEERIARSVNEQGGMEEKLDEIDDEIERRKKKKETLYYVVRDDRFRGLKYPYYQCRGAGDAHWNPSQKYAQRFTTIAEAMEVIERIGYGSVYRVVSR